VNTEVGINDIKNFIYTNFPTPECEREAGCIAEGSLVEYVCGKHQRWNAAMKIVKFIEGGHNE
jgi:hypothetical protein